MREVEIIVNEDVEIIFVNDFFTFSVKYHNLSSTADTIPESEKLIVRWSTTGIWLIGDNELLIGEDGNWRDISKELSFFLEWQNPDSIHSPISLKMLFYAIVDSLKYDYWKTPLGTYQEHSIRISEIAQHYSKRAIREEQKSIQKELDRVILEDLKRDFINRAKKKLEPTPEERMKEAWEAHKRLEALFIRNGVIGEKFISDPLALKDWDSLTEEDKALILPVFEGMTEEEIKAYWNDISPINREMIINRK